MDNYNDETFGFNDEELQTDFNFNNNKEEPMTLEMIEKELLQQQQSKIKKEYVEPKMPTTVEELEKELIQIGAKSFKQVEKQGRVMSTNDQNFILKMALAQIAMTDEYDEDFYHNVYLMVRREASKSRQSSSDYLQLLVKGSKKKKLTFTATLEKIVEKKRNAATIGFVIEGALGKVSTSSSKKPRQAIAIPQSTFSFNDSQDGLLSTYLPLKMIEDIYKDVIELETWKRKAKRFHQEQDVKVTMAEIDTEIQKLSLSLVKTFTTILNRKMMRVFPRAFRFLPDELCNDLVLSILKSLQYCSLVTQFEHIQTSIHAVNTWLSSLNNKVVQLPVAIQSSFNNVMNYMLDLDIWHSTAFSAIQSCIMDMEFTELNKGFEHLLSGISLSAVIRTSYGVHILGAMLSRADVLKSNNPNAEFDLLFSQFYTAVKPYLSLCFPLQQVNFPHPAFLLHCPYPMTPEEYVLKLTNDNQVWQFLAAMVISADSTQQTEIVSEVRERVMWNASGTKDASFSVGQSLRYTFIPDKSFDKMTGERAVSNVNLFLHSLGFDSSQL